MCIRDRPTIRHARQLLRAGNILAIKGLGGFLLACDARNEAAIEELRRRKRRPAKPFALMARDLTSLRDICEISLEDENALQSLRRPIVVLPRLVNPSTLLPEALAPANRTLGSVSYTHLASIIMWLSRPGLGGSVTFHAFSNLARIAGSSTF